MRALLDTSAYSAFKRNHPGVLEIVRDCQEILFSPVVAGELLAGFRRGDNLDRNLAELREFLDHPRVRITPLTLTTADRYGRAWATLRRRGTPIPTNDLWVAAQALETGADLVALDRHFQNVDGLALIDLS